ncbi:TPA: hypothetical protein DCW54_02720 [Candidatus Dependentiae bacterium]|nr:hypothetical protein [Candidatus Dependentiae bacterium]
MNKRLLFALLPITILGSSPQTPPSPHTPKDQVSSTWQTAPDLSPETDETQEWLNWIRHLIEYQRSTSVFHDTNESRAELERSQSLFQAIDVNENLQEEAGPSNTNTQENTVFAEYESALTSSSNNDLNFNENQANTSNFIPQRRIIRRRRTTNNNAGGFSSSPSIFNFAPSTESFFEPIANLTPAEVAQQQTPPTIKYRKITNQNAPNRNNGTSRALNFTSSSSNNNLTMNPEF